MVRRILPPILVILVMAAAGCFPEGGGYDMWSHSPASPSGMVVRGPDDAQRLDVLNRHRVFELENQVVVRDAWDRASVDKVDPAEEALKRLDRRRMRLTERGELEFERANAETVIEELIARCEGVEFFDMKGEGRRQIEGLVLTAKAGRIDKDMVFPYLRAVFQMNGFDLVPVDIPFYGKGFQVVRLEDFDWAASTAR